jgi:hypothetical protein
LKLPIKAKLGLFKNTFIALTTDMQKISSEDLKQLQEKFNADGVMLLVFDKEGFRAVGMRHISQMEIAYAACLLQSMFTRKEERIEPFAGMVRQSRKES